MRLRLFILVFVFINLKSSAQVDNSKWLRGFPITSYIIDITDSAKVVQVYLPGGPAFKEKQIGLLRGLYNGLPADTMIIGTGRCHLIKGDYYYFTISYKKGQRLPKENDLLYTFVDPPLIYRKQFAVLASHFIELQNVYEDPFYDRVGIFNKWKEEDEKSTIDSMVSDIQFTGQYFLKNDPSMDVLIKTGQFRDQKVLSVMTKCQPGNVKDFLNYVIARPRLYAGKKWKMSEIFATWLSAGAPVVMK
ncbi:MAG TPA: hypothetical protein VF487_13010 [Chitinophagaceae bacterium]